MAIMMENLLGKDPKIGRLSKFVGFSGIALVHPLAGFIISDG
jgi:hypothetical protein